MRDFVLELDRPRKLVFDFDAWALLEEKYAPKSSQDFNVAQIVNLKVSEVPYLAYAGLHTEDPELTPERTKELLNAQIKQGKYTMMAILNIVTDAIFDQFGIAKPKAPAGETEKKAAGPAATVPGSRKKGR